jgi:hypothetical protein
LPEPLWEALDLPKFPESCLEDIVAQKIIKEKLFRKIF